MKKAALSMCLFSILVFNAFAAPAVLESKRCGKEYQEQTYSIIVNYANQVVEPYIIAEAKKDFADHIRIACPNFRYIEYESIYTTDVDFLYFVFPRGNGLFDQTCYTRDEVERLFRK